MRANTVTFIVLFVLSCVSGCGQAGTSPAVQATAWIEGIDLSHHNGTVDWDVLDQSAIGFIYLKATEGRDLKDPRFQDHWREAVARGWRVGAYHFYRLCVPGDVQAANFIQSVEVREGTLPPAVDLEYAENCTPAGSPEDTRAQIEGFLDAIEAEYGQRPVIYTTREFHADWIAGSFEEYPLWLRSLGHEPRQAFVIWQYAMTGRVRGIEGPVDLNRMHGQEGKPALLEN